MPELPEVESVRRQLEPALVGRRFERVSIDDPRLVRPYEPAEVAAELEGERVAAVERRGKYLIVRFESGRVLLIHLRMTGSLLSAPNGSLPDDPHRRAVVKLDDGSDVAYRDVRRFGTWLLLEPGEAEPYLAARVGDEPLDALFTAARLGERLAVRRTIAQGGAARSAHPRWTGEHLRRRGSLARAAQPAASGGRPRPQRVAAATPRDPRSARARARQAGLDAPRLSPARRQRRLDAERVPRLRTPRRALRPLRNADLPHAGRRPDDVVLSGVPAGGAGSGGEELVETTFTVEAPELGIAADRPAVDEDLGHSPAAARHRTPSAGRPGRRRARSPRTGARGSRGASSPARRSRTSASYTSGSWALPLRTHKAHRLFLPVPSLDCKGHGRTGVQHGSRRAPVDAARRGRSRASPLHRGARPGRRGGEGRAQDDVALRCATRAALARRSRPPSRARRAPDGDRGAARPVAPGGARGLLPLLGRDDRRRGDAASLQRGGGERAGIHRADALPRSPRRHSARRRPADPRPARARVPAQAALARRLPAARHRLRRVRRGRGAARRLLAARRRRRLRAVRAGGRGARARLPTGSQGSRRSSRSRSRTPRGSVSRSGRSATSCA